MGQLLVPALIGGGLGAVGGAVTGQNPFKSALLGAGLGAGGAGLMGAGAAGGSSSLLSGLKGVEAAVPSLGSGGYAALGQNALGPIGGAATGGINFGANGINSTLGGTNLPLGGQGIQIDKFNPAINFTDDGLTFADKGLSSADQMFANKFVTEQNPFAVDPRRMAVNTPLSLGEQFTDMIGNPFTDLTSRDKLGLGLQGASMLNQPQQMIQPQAMPIKPGNPDMVSTPLYNVAPSIGRQEGNEIGLPNLMTRMPLTEEEKMRLQQLAQGYRG